MMPSKGGPVRSDPVIKIALIAIAVSLAVLVLRLPLIPTPVHAEPSEVQSYKLFIEPGTTTVKAPDGSSQFLGKVMIDMRNGNIWGFPTQSSAPYPIDSTRSIPPVSHPTYLGRFDLAATSPLTTRSIESH
jgi:hypothetical protein